VRLLLDTHLLIWLAMFPDRLSQAARILVDDPRNEPIFSAASIWEAAIKSAQGRADFRIDPRLLYQGLLDNGYTELPITSRHAVHIDALPAIHKDPFDRLLLAQAIGEGVTLVTADAQLARIIHRALTPVYVISRSAVWRLGMGSSVDACARNLVAIAGE
jgi:PIN domain nuclease of toxin-antitoxin system